MCIESSANAPQNSRRKHLSGLGSKGLCSYWPALPNTAQFGRPMGNLPGEPISSDIQLCASETYNISLLPLPLQKLIEEEPLVEEQSYPSETSNLTMKKQRGQSNFDSFVKSLKVVEQTM
eukprot:CAMPEP_0114980090 /NCGR_PEP_ID=MMETSP0216-20121206/4762_1 /TAXON_ID=223996 /ORGANISM="Protocruzia adherens, Strain Boccale" /LENGTH=119 /DNA_ID=CAMNT_0002341545 /DNA_START=603 /DNA_END=959 /DNA_ORIENTATION=+